MSVFAVLVLLLAIFLGGALVAAIVRGRAGGWITAGRRLTEAGLVLMALVVVIGGIVVVRDWDEPLRADAVLLQDAVAPVAAALPDGVELPGEAGTQVAGDDTGVWVRTGRVPVTAVLTSPSTGQRLLAPVPAVLAIATIAVGLLLLRRLLLRAGEGDPFTAAGARDLRLLGAVVLGGAALIPMVDFAVSTALVSAATDVATAEATFSFAWILGAVLVLALAEVWAAGVRMREDLEGVV